MKIKAVRGFKDILPGETDLWQRTEAVAAGVLRNFGYKEIRVPVVERTELFARSIGSDTDIVEKEMYSFPDRHGKSLTLRPEATAGVVRAVIEHSLAGDGRPLKLYSIGPMFRYERPQKGRQRQFHQLNVEAFNVNSPRMDAEMIAMLGHILAELELDDVVMNINNLGCPVCRPGFKQKLQDFLQEKRGELCPDCQRRMDTNPLRVLDCKVPGCAEPVQDAPVILDSLCPPCRDHFDAVKKDLHGTNVAFTVNPRLVRGLDYYTRTTFEAQTGELGSQNAVAGGGRYDGLVKTLGGPDIPAIGFAVGLERLVMLLEAQKRQPPAGPDLFVATLDEPSAEAAFGPVQELRRM
ncbi:MAG: histidine--tRNA ligase, partial [Thermodesulfobacteriota bacterium]|nr:histidine--tRNA ligase [Thermodesulfobacteriota bacterium]